MSSKKKEEIQSPIKQYGIPALIGLLSILIVYFVGITWILLFLALMIIGLIIYLVRPLEEPEKTKNFAKRRFSHLKVKDSYDYVIVG